LKRAGLAVIRQSGAFLSQPEFFSNRAAPKAAKYYYREKSGRTPIFFGTPTKKDHPKITPEILDAQIAHINLLKVHFVE
jgi:hypothetical protein